GRRTLTQQLRFGLGSELAKEDLARTSCDRIQDEHAKRTFRVGKLGDEARGGHVGRQQNRVEGLRKTLVGRSDQQEVALQAGRQVEVERLGGSVDFLACEFVVRLPVLKISGLLDRVEGWPCVHVPVS